MRRGILARWATILSAAAAAGCAGAPPSPSSVAAPAPSLPAPARAFATLAEAEPALTALEDRRAYDAATVEEADTSADAAVRARGALALGRIGDERASGSIRALLSDRSPGVRTVAAFAAGVLGEPALTSALVPLLSDPDAAVVSRAAWAIGFLAAPEGQDALIAAVGREQAPERSAAMLRGLWRFSTPAAAAAALPHVAAADERIRAAALYVLARRPLPSSLPALTAGLADPDADSAALCARALGVLGKPESIEPLLAAIGGTRSPVTINAMMALSIVLEKSPGSALPASARSRLLALSGDANPNVAVPALALLRWLAVDREVFRRLWTVASAGSERRQQVALQSLMGALGEKSDDLVDSAMGSAKPFLRGAAAEALSFLPEADAAPRRSKLSADPEVVVRLKVLEGLRSADSVRGNRALVDGMRADADPGVRAAAIDALAILDDPAMLPAFEEAVRKSYGERAPDVPIEAIAAAERQASSPAARAVVEAAYRHPSTLVSRLARRALVKTFRADPSALPWREYVTGKSVPEYGALLAEARRPWVARIDTARGAFTVRLEGDAAPLTVMNFVTLAHGGFFDGAVIHRVVPNFVVQDGDPTGTGNGGPGYEIRDEIGAVAYGRGAVGMALSGPDTGGSQWFVTQSPQPHLDGMYTAFGSVVSGMEVVERIEQGDRILRVTVAAGAG